MAIAWRKAEIKFSTTDSGEQSTHVLKLTQKWVRTHVHMHEGINQAYLCDREIVTVCWSLVGSVMGTHLKMVASHFLESSRNQ